MPSALSCLPPTPHQFILTFDGPTLGLVLYDKRLESRGVLSRQLLACTVLLRFGDKQTSLLLFWLCLVTLAFFFLRFLLCQRKGEGCNELSACHGRGSRDSLGVRRVRQVKVRSYEIPIDVCTWAAKTNVVFRICSVLQEALLGGRSPAVLWALSAR